MTSRAASAASTTAPPTARAAPTAALPTLRAAPDTAPPTELAASESEPRMSSRCGVTPPVRPITRVLPPCTTLSAALSASTSSPPDGAAPPAGWRWTTGTASCWIVWASSWAMTFLPAPVAGRYSPGAKKMSAPWAKARAPRPLASWPAGASSCTRTCEKSAPKRGSISRRSVAESGAPPPRRPSMAAITPAPPRCALGAAACAGLWAGAGRGGRGGMRWAAALPALAPAALILRGFRATSAGRAGWPCGIPASRPAGARGLPAGAPPPSPRSVPRAQRCAAGPRSGRSASPRR